MKLLKRNIILTMIVKNEAHIIARCLTSTLPLIDGFYIMDTGSTDGTQQVITEFFRTHNIPGSVIDTPWVDFATNRTLVLANQLVANDYSLMIDADEVVVFADDFIKDVFINTLTTDAIYITTRLGTITYQRPQLTHNAMPFFYKGILHEYLDCSEEFTRQDTDAFINTPIQDGARSQSSTKYQDDAELLAAAVLTERDPMLLPRYTFYAAQSYRDCGNHVKALEFYNRCIQLNTWNEEIFISLLNCARLLETLQRSPEEIIQAYMAAYEYMPTRIEGIYGAIKYCRSIQKYNQGYALTKIATTISLPSHGLFTENWIYEYGLLDEIAVLAYWVGHYQEALETTMTLIESPTLPPEYMNRVLHTMDCTLTKLKELTEINNC